jgi:nucleotide-binding universal stress UspA family protein
MTELKIDSRIKPDDRERAGPSSDRLIVVVGFDGSEPAYRALDAATQLISGRTGSIEVVYVSHTPVTAALSPDAQSEARKDFDAIEHEFAQALRVRLAGGEQRWHFQRRDGLIAHELVASADQLMGEYGVGTRVVIVVGSAMHTYHHVVGSVPVALVRHATYPIVVVP